AVRDARAHRLHRGAFAPRVAPDHAGDPAHQRALPLARRWATTPDNPSSRSIRARKPSAAAAAEPSKALSLSKKASDRRENGGALPIKEKADSQPSAIDTPIGRGIERPGWRTRRARAQAATNSRTVHERGPTTR